MIPSRHILSIMLIFVAVITNATYEKSINKTPDTEAGTKGQQWFLSSNHSLLLSRAFLFMETRICKECGKEAPLNLDYFHQKGPGRLNLRCKDCVNREQRKKRVPKKIIPDVLDGQRYCGQCDRVLALDGDHFYRSSDPNNGGFLKQCKECRGGIFGAPRLKRKPLTLDVRSGEKWCPKCERTLSCDEIHFTRSSYSSNGFNSYCKECRGYTFGVHHNIKVIQPTDGTAICTKCSTHYPSWSGYFYKDAQKSTGYRTICKKCCKAKADERVDELREYKRKYECLKRANDENYNLYLKLASRIRCALKEQKKSARTMELVGCSLMELRNWLTMQFTEGMTWVNYGRFGWHIDHVKPCAMFDLTDPDQQTKCFHYTNLQPMWWNDNISKGAKYNGVDYSKPGNKPKRKKT